MKKIGFLLTYLILIYFLNSCASHKMNTSPMYGGLEKSFWLKSADKAFVETTINQTGGNIDSAYNAVISLAMNYLFRKDLETSMKRFNQSWLIDELRPEAYYGFYILSEIKGELEESQKYFSMGETKDTSHQALIKMLISFIKYKEIIQDYKGAIKTCTKALTYDPKNDFIYFSRGYYFGIIGLEDKALSDYNIAIDLGTKQINAYVNRGFTYYTQKQYTKALQDYDRAIIINDNHIRAYANRAICYYEMEEFEKSLQDLKKCRELDPKHKPFIEMIKEVELQIKNSKN